MTIYRQYIQVTMGCGCSVEQEMELPEGMEPNGDTGMAFLIDLMLEPEFQEMIMMAHKFKGDEVLDIKIRTKVGPLDAED